jgi:hypothetical protein
MSQDSFERLKSSFDQKATEALGTDATNSRDRLSVYVSKKLVENAIETGFNTAEISVAATVKQRGYEIETQDIRIKEIKVECDEIQCDSCDKGCGRLDFGCKAEEAWCETFSRKPCLIRKAAKEEACHIARVLAARLSGTRLGTARFRNVKAGGEVSTTTITLDLDPTLKNAALKADQFRGDLRASGELYSRESLEVIIAQLLTVGIGACHPIQRITADNIPVTAVTDTINFDTTFEKTTTPSENGMGLKLKVMNANLKLKTNLNPLLNVLDQNPQLFITCTLAAVALTAVGVVNTIFPIPLKFDQHIPKLTSFDIAEIKIDIPGGQKPLILVPFEGDLSLGVAEKP